MSNPIDLVARGAPSPAEQAAIAKAIYNFTVELWTLYSIAVSITLLRTYARSKVVGFRNLKADDYLAWVAVIFYTVQTSLAYKVVVGAQGLANNGMTPAERAALSPSSPEWHMRVVGSKIQVAGWATYSALIGTLKLSMLAFYVRLMDGLGKRYRYPIYFGFLLVIGCFIASIVTILAACRPFNHYWQINPSPGNICEAAISRPIIWVTFASNVATDPYLILIPIPMLWGSQLKLLKKFAATLVLSAGVFVLVCATLKVVFVIVDPINGPRLAGEWGVRECFVATVTTNLPMLFQLLRSVLNFFFGDRFGATTKNLYKSPSGGFQSFGAGSNPYSKNRRGLSSSDPTTVTLTYNDSEERMVDGHKMHDMKVFTEPVAGLNNVDSNGIVVSNQIEVTSEERNSHNGERPGGPQVAREPW